MKMLLCLFLSASVVVVGTSLVPKAVAQRLGGGGRGGGGGGGDAARGAPIPASAHSLVAAATSAAPIGADGFIQRWLLLEPIPCNGIVTDKAVQATVKTEWFPNQYSVMPKDGEKVTSNGLEYLWHAMDTKNYNVDLAHFGHFLGKNTANAIFWGVTVVNCPQELKNVRLAIGSNSASVWWVNGQEVVGIYGDIQTTIDDGVSKRITLKPGPNIIRIALVNNGGATDFCARFLDEQGNPVKNLTVSLGDAVK